MDDDSDGLRWYQLEARAAIEQQLEQVRSTMLVMATGLGKTQTFASVAKRWTQGDILVLAHRSELVEQARVRLEQMTGQQVGIEKAGERGGQAHIVVGSTQTMMRDKRMDEAGRDRYGLVIVDESHHYSGNRFAKPLSYFNAKILGVTATPDRHDGRAMGMTFDSVAYIMDIEDGINHGFLVPLQAKEVDVREIDISDVGAYAGDLAVGQLDEAMLRAVEPVVRGIFEHGEGRAGLCFFPGIASATYAAERANALRPGCARVVSGKTDDEERAAIVAAFKRGDFPLLFNCMLLTEGFDAPHASLIAVARPTKSRALFAQMVGRGTRAAVDAGIDAYQAQDQAGERRAAIDWSSKPDTLILNFVGNAGKHTLATPTDVLSGNYTQAEVALAKKKKQGSVQENLQAARSELKALAAKVKASAQTEARAYDPLSILGLDPDQEAAKTEQYGRTPPSPAQVSYARSLGFTRAELDGLSRWAVSRLLDKATGRKIHGLASFAQMRALSAWGVADQNIRAENAQRAIDYLQRRWQFPSSISPAEVAAIARGERNA